MFSMLTSTWSPKQAFQRSSPRWMWALKKMLVCVTVHMFMNQPSKKMSEALLEMHPLNQSSTTKATLLRWMHCQNANTIHASKEAQGVVCIKKTQSYYTLLFSQSNDTSFSLTYSSTNPNAHLCTYTNAHGHSQIHCRESLYCLHSLQEWRKRRLICFFLAQEQNAFLQWHVKLITCWNWHK